MKHTPDNPPTNQLGSGITESRVVEAVERSGYPLQVHVAAILRSTVGPCIEPFGVLEEWSYLDRDSGELRNVDLHAELRLHEWDPQPRVRPKLNVLIECKQSQLPYVFFLSPGNVVGVDFPVVAGLRKDRIVAISDDDPSSWNLTVMHALDLHEDPYQVTPPFCHTLSKCVRKGSDVELSGSEAYNSLILPLVKALHHFKHTQTSVETAWYWDAHLAIGLGVLDAPMVAVNVENGPPVFTAMPWVRALRHEYQDKTEHSERNRIWILDIVHRDYFASYLSDHLLPFAGRFAQRILRHPTELATGAAFVPGMGANGWNAIEQRMQPRSRAAGTARTLAIGRSIAKLFRRMSD